MDNRNNDDFFESIGNAYNNFKLAIKSIDDFMNDISKLPDDEKKDISKVLKYNNVVSEKIKEGIDNYTKAPYDYNKKDIRDMFDDITNENHEKEYENIIKKLDERIDDFEDSISDDIINNINLYARQNEDFKKDLLKVLDRYIMDSYVLEGFKGEELKFSVPFTKAEFEQVKEEPSLLKDLLEKYEVGRTIIDIFNTDFDLFPIFKNNKKNDKEKNPNEITVRVYVQIDGQEDIEGAYTEWTLKLRKDCKFKDINHREFDNDKPKGGAAPSLDQKIEQEREYMTHDHNRANSTIGFSR